MIQGIDVNQRIEFVSEKDSSEPKTVFIFKPLSGFEMLDVQDGGLDLKRFIKRTIIEVKGVEDKDLFLESLPLSIVGELIKKANEVNKLTEEETKN